MTDPRWCDPRERPHVAQLGQIASVCERSLLTPEEDPLLNEECFYHASALPLSNPLNMVCVFLVRRGQVLEAVSMLLTPGGPSLVLTSSQVEDPVQAHLSPQPWRQEPVFPLPFAVGRTKTRALPSASRQLCSVLMKVELLPGVGLFQPL